MRNPQAFHVRKHAGRHIDTVSGYPVRSRRLARSMDWESQERLKARRRATVVADKSKALEVSKRYGRTTD